MAASQELFRVPYKTLAQKRKRTTSEATTQATTQADDDIDDYSSNIGHISNDADMYSDVEQV